MIKVALLTGFFHFLGMSWTYALLCAIFTLMLAGFYIGYKMYAYLMQTRYEDGEVIKKAQYRLING